MPTVSVRSKQSFNGPAVTSISQTIATVAAHDAVVFIGAHAGAAGFSANPSVGGVAMTAIQKHPVFTGDGGGYEVDIWYLKDASGGAVGSSKTFSATYNSNVELLGAIYVLQNTDTSTQPTSNGGSESTNAADPQTSVSCSAGDLILAGLASNVQADPNDGQTQDFLWEPDAHFQITEKTASAGSNNQSWTMSSDSFALNIIAIKAGTPPASSQGNFFRLF
jgi:hypothetical protein